MKIPRLPGYLALAVFLSVQVFAAPTAGKFLGTEAFDATKAIPVPPADDSVTTAADLETVYQIQQRRTPEQVALANYFADASIFQYQGVLGSWFTAANLPLTAEFFAQVDADRFAISSKGKAVWNRPRPPLLDPRIKACVLLPTSGSYPSGHTTQAFLWAGLLGEIFPAQKAALRERAQLVGWSRIVGGVHHPTDVAAGRMLGDSLVQAFLKVPGVQAALTGVRAEVAAAQAKVPAAVH